MAEGGEFKNFSDPKYLKMSIIIALGYACTPPLGLDIDRCITKTSQKSKMAKMLYVINVMLHENASVKKIKNEQIIFLCLIKLDSLNRKIYLHYCL